MAARGGRNSSPGTPAAAPTAERVSAAGLGHGVAPGPGLARGSKALSAQPAGTDTRERSGARGWGRSAAFGISVACGA